MFGVPACLEGIFGRGREKVSCPSTCGRWKLWMHSTHTHTHMKVIAKADPCVLPLPILHRSLIELGTELCDQGDNPTSIHKRKTPTHKTRSLLLALSLTHTFSHPFLPSQHLLYVSDGWEQLDEKLEISISPLKNPNNLQSKVGKRCLQPLARSKRDYVTVGGAGFYSDIHIWKRSMIVSIALPVLLH